MNSYNKVKVNFGRNRCTVVQDVDIDVESVFELDVSLNDNESYLAEAIATSVYNRLKQRHEATKTKE